MKKISWVVGVAGALIVGVLACSSSSGGSSSVPACQGGGATGAGSAACSSCLQSKCGSEVSAANSSCGAYVSCYQGCQCSDLNCIVGCTSKIDSACQGAYKPLTDCMTGNCSSECTTTVIIDGGTE